MTELQRLQQQFLHYLTDNDTAIAEAVADQGPVGRDTGLRIYHNAYRQRLKGVIDTDHPMLGAYLGDDLFAQMVTGYIAQHPSHRPSLRDFAEQLPDFLHTTEPFSQHPILAELARFERRLLNAFDAPDAPRISLSDLQAIAPEHWPAMQFRFHPSVQPFATAWNAVESWQALKAERTPPKATGTEGTWVLWRNRERLTEFRSLADDEHRAFDALLKGDAFADVCEAMLTWHTEEAASHVVVNFLVTWLNAGWLTQVVVTVE